MDKPFANLDTALAELNQALRQFDGGRAMVWDLIRYKSVLIVAFSAPKSTKVCAYLDCISCTKVAFSHSWEPAHVFVELCDPVGTSLTINDGQSLQIECKTARLTDATHDNRQLFTSPAGIRTSVDLLAYACEAESTSFNAMTGFFDGYSSALSDHLLPWRDQKPSFNAFQSWVKAKPGCDKMSADWKHAVRATYADDKDAIVQFRRLLIEFYTEYDAGNVVDPPPGR